MNIDGSDQSFLISFHSNSDGYVDQLSTNLEPTMDHDFFFEKLPPDLMSDEYLSRIYGEYELESSGTGVTLAKTGNKLFVTVVGQPPYELEAYRDDEFKLKDLNGFSVKFYFDDKHSPSTHLEFLQPNGIFKAVRK